MRIYNCQGRLALGVDDMAVDVEAASDGAFEADVGKLFDRWDELVDWVRRYDGKGEAFEVDATQLGPPVPRPPQVFGIGLNYREHALEAGLQLPERPMVFTKFPGSVTGPSGAIALPSGSVDFEVELVVVIGRRAERVPADRAWEVVAGLTVGQDLSDRELQFAGSTPQFSLAKSFTGFAPIGPALVTPDEVADLDDLALGCQLNGELMQRGHTSDLIFPIADLIAYLSSVLPLFPGDLIFTGTPSGTGWSRNPKRTLRVGDQLLSWVEGIGSMHHTFASPIVTSPSGEA